MKGIAIGLVVVLAFFFGIPLGLVLIMTTVAAPALGEEYRTQYCEGAIPPTGEWRPPFQQEYTVTSGFGDRFHPIDHEWRLHSGIDLVSLPGPGPVVAASAGRVTFSGWAGSGGNSVSIEHAGGIVTRYHHMANPSSLAVGDPVYSGQQVGMEGTTGSSTGNHLHFEVWVNGEPVDPAPFMLARGAALNGSAVAPSPPPGEGPEPELPEDGEGGIGFELPPPGEPRQASLNNPPTPIPAGIETLYREAAAEYNLPWALLAGIGMEETNHGRNTATSSAGAQGMMQFMPATWASYGVDGNGDGVADIHNDADSAYSAANYLVASGVMDGPQGVRDALWAYNHADWYVNDVLYYAAAYGGGLVLAEGVDCGPGSEVGNPNLPPIDNARVEKMLTFAGNQVGDSYIMGANGPNAWDCSSLTMTALAHIGITSPRTAGAQRDWLAAGNGFRVPVEEAQPGDLLFWDSYLGPNQIGHVALVWDPATKTTIEAANPSLGVGHFSYADNLDNNIFEVWRVGSISDSPKTPAQPMSLTGHAEGH
ncbi:peptidoglycan DD-metalloendopeptidase family protein [Ornithinimicrobium cavernae]|uniref:peptidoglycan DD-metalloendopeptidase family protein n=1 Tax=Ornithinimicrobium cavernae TaxID=2666047 RepID=UPI000D690B69|nr:peptidoglycan DD-metalloendopeptidase family protein [Ornithinimicrobium cavernae]